MAGGYRCSHGHTWATRAGPLPASCPVCGDTVVMAADPTAEAVPLVPGPTFVVDPPADHPDPGGKAATLPPDAARAATAPAPSATATLTLPPTRRDSSFSSLVGMPAPMPGVSPAEPPGGFGLDPGSVVPFGPGETVDFTPPLVPGFEILQEVGRGGMGVVYKARQLNLNRPVALKMILAGSHAGPAERDRFRREAEAVATLQNPHIVQIFEIGEADGHLYLALEFVDGGSLAQHLKEASWSAREAAALVETLARAVHYAHSQGVVHRDLKPGNVLLQRSEVRGQRTASNNSSTPGLWPLTSDLFPKVTDFGLAKRLGDSADPGGTKTGAVMGTPSYIAPEQASGRTRDVGPGADVYALGAILYELLTGRPPFTGETPLDTVLQVLHDDPVPPKRLQASVPRDLETICLKCLNKSPAKRYASAADLADDLGRFLRGEPIRARPLSAWGRGVKWARRHPSLAALGVVTAAATLALVGVLSVAYAHVREAVTQKDAEAKAARLARENEAEERRRAEEARRKALVLAEDNEKRRKEADDRAAELKREADRTRRAAYALQLAQVAAMCERDPRRALVLLEDEARCPADLRDFAWAYLRRLCQRDERAYADHGNDPLRAVAVSPTGDFVATAGEAGQVRVWDPRTGRTWAVLVGHAGRVLGVAFSPDGGALATAGADHAVRLWELPLEMLESARKFASYLSGVPILQKPLALAPAVTLADAHAGEVNCVAFSPDGRRLVSGGEDGMLKWWDVGGWRAANPDLAAAGGPAAAAAVVAAARSAPDARPVWVSRAEYVHPGGVKCLAFAASGKILASGGADRVVRVWSPDGANLIRAVGGHGDAVLAVAVTPDGRTIASANNGNTPTVRVINAETGRDVRRLTGHTGAIYALALSREGDLLASAGFDKSVRLWDLEDGKERGLLLGHDQRVSGVGFAPDRRSLVSAAMDGTARVWQTTARPFDAAELGRGDTALTAAAVSGVGAGGPGATFVTGDETGRVNVYRSDGSPPKPGAAGGAPPFLVAHIPITSPGRSPVKAVAASPDGKTVLAATAEAVFVWRVLALSGRRPVNAPPLALHRPVAVRVPRPVYALAVDPSGRWLATLDDQGVRLWDLHAVPGALDSPGRRATPEGPGLILPVADARELTFDPTGERLAVAAGNGVRVIDRTGRVLDNHPDAHDGRVETVAFGGLTGELLATGDVGGLVRVWRVAASGKLTPQAELVGHTGAVYSLAFSPSGRTLATAGFDRLVLLWDPMTGNERAALTGHADRVLRVHFLADSSALVTVGRDGGVRRWRADEGRRSPTAARQSTARPQTSASG